MIKNKPPRGKGEMIEYWGRISAFNSRKHPLNNSEKSLNLAHNKAAPTSLLQKYTIALKISSFPFKTNH
jgi:hypothetical protein